jgi:hypothetical protein
MIGPHPSEGTEAVRFVEEENAFRLGRFVKGLGYTLLRFPHKG